MPACGYRAAEGAPELAGQLVVAESWPELCFRVGLLSGPIATSQLPPAPLLLMRSCSPSHTRSHRAACAARGGHGLGSTSVALPGGSHISKLQFLGACGALPQETEGTQPRALRPPEAVHTTHLGHRHTCAPVQVTQPCASASSRVPVNRDVRNEHLWVQWLRLSLPMQGPQVQSRVGERRFRRPRSQIKKRESRREGGRLGGRRHVRTCS